MITMGAKITQPEREMAVLQMDSMNHDQQQSIAQRKASRQVEMFQKLKIRVTEAETENEKLHFHNGELLDKADNQERAAGVSDTELQAARSRLALAGKAYMVLEKAMSKRMRAFVGKVCRLAKGQSHRYRGSHVLDTVVGRRRGSTGQSRSALGEGDEKKQGWAAGTVPKPASPGTQGQPEWSGVVLQVSLHAHVKRSDLLQTSMLQCVRFNVLRWTLQA